MKQKRSRKKLEFKDGVWKAISSKSILYESRKFERANSAKLNIIAVKRFFDELTFTDIELAFHSKNNFTTE